MGNCLQGSETDDINLIQGDNDSSTDASSTVHRRNSDENSVVVRVNTDTATNFRPPPTYEETLVGTAASSVVYHPSPGVSRAASELTEEEQIKIAQRIGLIQHLPVDIFVEGSKTDKECIICMLDFNEGEPIRFLPCMHTYHVACIDDWLMRSFTCPSCLEPVDSALLTSYDQQAMTGGSSVEQLGQLTAANEDKENHHRRVVAVVVNDKNNAANNNSSSSTFRHEDSSGSFNNRVFDENVDHDS